MAVELTAAVCVPLSLLVPLLKRPCRSSVMDVSTDWTWLITSYMASTVFSPSVLSKLPPQPDRKTVRDASAREREIAFNQHFVPFIKKTTILSVKFYNVPPIFCSYYILYRFEKNKSTDISIQKVQK